MPLCVHHRRCCCANCTASSSPGKGGDGDGDVAVAESVSTGAGAERIGTTTLIGRHREKMDVCCGSHGAGGDGGGRGADSSAASSPPLVRVLAGNAEAMPAGTFDVVVDATGSPQGLAAASELCRPMG